MTTKVLVVDDELDTLNLLRVLLELTGFEPVTTLNSTEAITLAEVEKVDVALLDIMMPKLDGFQLCRMMREHTTLKDLPIIFITAYDALDLEDRRREAGADHVVHKPINIDLLTDVISDIREKRLNSAIVPNKPDVKLTTATVAPTPVAEAKPVDIKSVDIKPIDIKPADVPKADEGNTPAIPVDETPKREEAPRVVNATETAVVLTPSSPMDMTFISTSSDDVDDVIPTTPVAETPRAEETPKAEPPKAPESTATPPASPSSTTEVAKPTTTDSTNSRTDTTPIKPHRPPTPQ